MPNSVDNCRLLAVNVVYICCYIWSNRAWHCWTDCVSSWIYVLRSLLLLCWLPGRTHIRKKRNESNKGSGRIRNIHVCFFAYRTPCLFCFFRNFFWQHVNNMKTNKHKQTDTMFPKYGFWLGIGRGNWVIMRCHLPYEPLDHWPGATHPLVRAHHQLSSGSSAQHPRSAGDKIIQLKSDYIIIITLTTIISGGENNLSNCCTCITIDFNEIFIMNFSNILILHFPLNPDFWRFITKTLFKVQVNTHSCAHVLSLPGVRWGSDTGLETGPDVSLRPRLPVLAVSADTRLWLRLRTCGGRGEAGGIQIRFLNVVPRSR